MIEHRASATTRTASSTRISGKTAAGGSAAADDQPRERLVYRIEQLIGQGGFGQVYLARRLGDHATVPEIVCIKVSTRIDGWLREAYFGQLLHADSRAIRVFDTFPCLPNGAVVRCSIASRSSTRASGI